MGRQISQSKLRKLAETWNKRAGNACFAGFAYFGFAVMLNFPSTPDQAFFQIAAVVLEFGIPAFAYHVFAVYIEERNRWPLIASICLGIPQFILLAIAVFLLVPVVIFPTSQFDFAVAVSSRVLFLLPVFFTLPAVVYSWKCLIRLQRDSRHAPRGFTPILPNNDAVEE